MNRTYVVLEGPDGGGKSTQARRLVAWLQGGGSRVVHLREPGSTPVGERLRSLVLDPATGDLSAAAEALLFFAARAEMLQREVIPALESGAIVVVERCYLSTWVYQGFAARDPVPMDRLRALTAWVHGAVLPALIVVLDVGPETMAARRELETRDRLEAREEAWHRRVRQGYLDLARGEERIEVVDGARSVGEVERDVRARVAAVLEMRP